ncbi:MAG: AsmA family protein [Humidesulfovibrio sp.]|nr:AsmA family protein [Humidesulfovibrio sp.]
MRKRLILILLCCLGAFGLASGAAIWWASSYMRTPEFRQELARLVRDATGREARLSGELTISVFPWFGLRAEGVSLGNDPAFGATPLLTAKTLGAHIKVLPLFEKRLVFDTLELDEASLVLTLDKEDRGNWDGLVEHLRAQENATDRADSYFRKITVRGIRLVDSQARLDDLKHNHSYIMSSVDLRTGRIEAGKALPFTVVTDFAWPRPGLTAHLEGAGKLHWSKADPKPLFTDTQVQGEIGGTFMPKTSPKAGISTTVSLEEAGKDLKLSDVRLRILGTDVTGEITFFDVTELFRLDARLKFGRFSPRSVINAYWPGAIAHDHQGALATAEGPLNLHANVDELVFETPGFNVDNARLRGKVRMGFGDVSGLDFGLAADKLDADADIAAFTSNATSTPLVVADLPLRYLREVKGAGRFTAETLKLAGVTGQGAVIDWQADGGVHRAQLKPFKTQGGVVSANISASFADGQPLLHPTSDVARPAVLGWSGSLRMEDVDARQVTWLNKGGVSTSGRLDLRAKAEAKPAPATANTHLALVLRRGAGDVSASLGPSLLEFAPNSGQPKAPPRRMQFSSLQTQGHFAPAPTGNADWAVQLDGGFAAVGTRPLLNLDAKVSGLLRSQQGRAVLSGASASGHLKGWFLPKGESEASFSGKGALDFAAQSLNLSAASAQACGLSLTGPLTGSKVLSADFSLAGRIRCQEGDPKRVLQALEIRAPKTSDSRVLQHLSGDANMTLSAKGLALTNISAQLDDLPLRGSYSVQDFDAPRQSLSLAGGNFDLDRYLPAPEVVKHGAKPERPTPEPLPVEALRELNLDGAFALRSFKYRGLTTRNFKTTVSAHGGSLLMKPLGGNFYGGTISGEFSAQVVAGGMQTRLAIAAKDFQAGPFMLGWAGKEVVTGKTDLFLDLTGAGATDLDVLRTLEGLGSFKIVNGSYVTTSGSGGEPNAQTVNRRPPSGVTTAQQASPARHSSPFSLASADLKVRKGVFASEDFHMNGANMVVTGTGRFSPADDTIAVNLTANMPGLPDVPIRVFGRLKDPEMEISTGTLIGNTIKEILGIPLKPIKFFKDLLF